MSPRNARQMTTRSDPYRSRKQTLEPIRIFIVPQNDGLVRVNSFECEEVEARLGIVSYQRDAVNPADRIRTVRRFGNRLLKEIIEHRDSAVVPALNSQ